jgi:hypothetical protein
MKFKVFLVVVVFALVAVGASVVYAQSTDPMSETRNPHTLVGSWKVAVIPDQATGMSPFVVYNAYTKDGVQIGTTETGHLLIGQWTRTGSNRFAGTYMGAEVYDGLLVHYKLRKALELSRDGDEYSGPYVVEVFDVDGNLLATIPGTLQGTRIQVEPLD